MTSSTYPTLSELLETLGEPPYAEPETKFEVSLRVLAALSALPSWRWAKMHHQVKRWYDKCYEQLHKTEEVFTYPVKREVALDHKALFESALQKNTMVKRAAQLYLVEPNLTGDRLYEILKMEGFQPKLNACRIMARTMLVLVGYLASRSFIDLKALFPPVEVSSSD